MLDCKPNNIPTNTNVKLSLDQGELASGRYIYRRVVGNGKFKYLTSCDDWIGVSLVVSVVSQFNCPCDSHS
jgi:hypothetical protein